METGYMNIIAKTIHDGDFTVAGMADDLGVTRHAIYRWIRGEAIPSKERMTQVCNYLGISPNEVYRWKR